MPLFLVASLIDEGMIDMTSVDGDSTSQQRIFKVKVQP